MVLVYRYLWRWQFISYFSFPYFWSLLTSLEASLPSKKELLEASLLPWRDSVVLISEAFEGSFASLIDGVSKITSTGASHTNITMSSLLAMTWIVNWMSGGRRDPNLWWPFRRQSFSYCSIRVGDPGLLLAPCVPIPASLEIYIYRWLLIQLDLRFQRAKHTCQVSILIMISAV